MSEWASCSCGTLGCEGAGAGAGSGSGCGAVAAASMAGISSEPDIAPFSGEEMKPRPGSVRRNLFGPVDHQQLEQDFQRLLRMSVEEATRRWNFDFQSDRPTPGATEWEELRCQDVPAFYRSCMVKSGAGPRAEPPSRPRGGSSPPVGEYLEITAREMYRSCKQEKRVSVAIAAAVKRRQATITDFFAVKKRKLLHPKGPRSSVSSDSSPYRTAEEK